MKAITALLLLFGVFIVSLAQGPSDRQQFIRVEAPVIALVHVRVIDGTGTAARDDQTIVIADGKIQSVGPGATATVPPGAQILDLKGYTVLPRWLTSDQVVADALAKARIRPAESSCGGRDQGLLRALEHLPHKVSTYRRKALQEFFH